MSLIFSKTDVIIYNFLREKKTSSFQELSNLGCDNDALRRSLEFLKSEGILKETSVSQTTYELTFLAKKALDHGFIEEIFCNFINKKKILLSSLRSLQIPGLSSQEISLAFGISKRLSLINIVDNQILVKEDFQKTIDQQKTFLKTLSSCSSPPEQFVNDFLQRKFILKKINLLKSYTFVLEKNFTEQAEYIIDLTPDMLKLKNYNLPFKSYDVTKLSKPAQVGRIHALKLIINYLKDVYLQMGFKEMQGPFVECAFWSMDSMFISQEHPMRDIQDTFYLPLKGSLVKNKPFLNKIKKLHENGWNTNSIGHQYTWNEELARALILRTHTTSVTFRTLYTLSSQEKKKSKYFCIGKCFRNETTDATHLAEFHHAEGFVIDDKISLSDLIGFSKTFLEKLGLSDFKFKPTYNPYTEPSLEILAFSKKHNAYIEIMNSGIFRREALAPYGIKNNVIAWGIGVERIAMLLLDKGNIKEIVGDECDIDFLRNYVLSFKDKI